MSNTATRYALAAGFAGFVSGVLTTVVWIGSNRVESSFSENISLPIQLIIPGLLFGTFLGGWIGYVRKETPGRIVAFILMVEVSWLAAYLYARTIADHWSAIWNAMTEIGIMAGFIGGVGMVLSSMIAFRLPLWPKTALVIIAAGTVAGALLPVEIKPEILTPLFYTWQAVVSVPIGWAVAKQL